MTANLQQSRLALVVAILASIPATATCAAHVWETGKVLDAQKAKSSVDTGATVNASTSGVGQNAETTGRVDIQSTTVTSTYLVVLGRDFAYTVTDTRSQDSLIPHPGMVHKGLIQALENLHHGCRFIVNDDVQFYQDKNTLHVKDADRKECHTEILRQERVGHTEAPQTNQPPAQRLPPVPQANVGERPTLKREDAPSNVDGSHVNVTQPYVIAKVDPVYTEQARAAGVSGAVQLAVVVSPEGHARDIRVVRGLGMGLDERAIEAVQQWIFRPGTKDGQPVNVGTTIEVNFRLGIDPPSR